MEPMTSTENAASIEMQEQLSALVDGELDEPTLAQLLAHMDEHDGMLCVHQSWQIYHVIGTAMRQPSGVEHVGSLDFLQRLNAQLAQEQPLSAPVLPPVHVSVASVAKPVQMPQREAANQSVFRWKMVAGVASLAVVSLLGWNLIGSVPAGGGVQQLAFNAAVPTSTAKQTLVQMPVTVGQNASVMLRDPRLDELLAARGQIGGAANLQMPASFLRNATFAEEKQFRSNCADKTSRQC